MYVFLKNIELIAYIPSLAHNPPPLRNFCHLPSTYVVSRSGASKPQITSPTGLTRWPRRWRCWCEHRPATQHRRFGRGGRPHAAQDMQEVDAPRTGGTEHGWRAGGELKSLVLVAFEQQELDGIFRGTAGSAGRMGLGIRIEDDQFYRSMCFCSRPSH